MRYLALLLLLVSNLSVAEQPWDTLKDSVVFLRSERYLGTGSIVESSLHKKYIITNWHVCVRSTQGLVYNFDDARTQVAHVVKSDNKVDLCLLEYSGPHTGIKVTQEAAVTQAAVYSRGYPHANLTETKGFILGTDLVKVKMQDSEDGQLAKCLPGFYPTFKANFKDIAACWGSFYSVTTSLFVLPGSSGSPVVNTRGELVGVVHAHQEGQLLHGNMIPAVTVRAFLSGY